MRHLPITELVSSQQDFPDMPPVHGPGKRLPSFDSVKSFVQQMHNHYEQHHCPCVQQVTDWDLPYSQVRLPNTHFPNHDVSSNQLPEFHSPQNLSQPSSPFVPPQQYHASYAALPAYSTYTPAMPVNHPDVSYAAPPSYSHATYAPGSFASKKTNKFSPDQTQVLRAVFATNPRPSSSEIDQIAEDTGLTSRQVKIWFQNTRSRSKPKSSTVTHKM
ncbi:hypothetical protein GEMRC1_012366 [Eukaryota sp. GEM-RC1]